MNIASIETVEHSDDPVVAFIPYLEVVPSAESDAGFTWENHEPVLSDTPAGGRLASAEPEWAVDVFDVPYSFDRSELLGSGINRELTITAPAEQLDLASLPGLSRYSGWNVAAVTPIGEGFAEVAITRPDGRSVVAATRESDLAELSTGAPVLGMESILESTEQTAAVGPAAWVRTPQEMGRKYVFGFRKVVTSFVADQAPKTTEAWLPIVRLHCPTHEGCRAEFTIGQAQGTEIGATISVLGSGGKTKENVNFRSGETLPADGSCVELSIPGRLHVETGTTRLKGDPIAYGLRLTMSDLDQDRKREEPIDPDYDLCGWEGDQLPPGSEERDRTNVEAQASSTPTWQKELERVTSGSLSIGVKLNNIPVNLGLSFDRVASQRDTVSAWLGPGALYTAYQPAADRTMEWCWSTRA